MRCVPLIFGLGLILGGYGLCTFDTFARAVTASDYRRQLQALPTKQIYSKAELTDAVSHVWTNRIAALRLDAYDRHQFVREIALASGYEGGRSSSANVVGVLMMVGGSFVLGVSVQLRKPSK